MTEIQKSEIVLPTKSLVEKGQNGLKVEVGYVQTVFLQFIVHLGHPNTLRNCKKKFEHTRLLPFALQPPDYKT